MRKKSGIVIFLIFFLSTTVFAEIQKEPLSRPVSINRHGSPPYKELIFPPGKLLSSHSPSIVELPDGALFVVWYAATSSGPNSVIWASRKPAGSDKWSDPWIVNQTPGYSNKNPVLYLGRDKRLWLIWANERRLFRSATIDTLRTKVSEDSGRTWGKDRKIDTPIGFLPRTHPVRLHDGTVLLPLYVNWSTSSVVMASRDDGSTWGKYRCILLLFGIQPTIIQRSDLSLFALTRTGMWPRFSWQAASYDLGRNWKGQKLSGIKNPGSSIEMVKLDSGNIVLAFNDSRTDRSGMSLALSYDGGRTWPSVRMIENDPGHIHTYPSIAQDKNGLIHVVYSYDSRKSIAHFVADEEWIKGLN